MVMSLYTANSPVHLRPAGKEEVEQLFEIHRAVFHPHIEEIWGWNEEWQREQFWHAFETLPTSIIQFEGLDAGYLQVDIDPYRIYLENIALSAQFQGKGLGRLLINDLQDQAELKRIHLELSVFRTNTRAKRFYRNLGFKQLGKTPTHFEMAWFPGDSRESAK